MPTVKSFVIEYNPVNEEGTFSEGDVVTGTVKLELSKEIKAKKLFVKAKGDANTRWTKKRGDHTYTYTGHRRYFKLKQFLIPENSDETVLPEGIHVYKFSFNIPVSIMPSSFKGSHGKIVYKLEAKLSRDWRMDSTAEKEFNFVSKCNPNLGSFMSPQAGSTNKEMGHFSKGRVDMNVTVNKGAFVPGETIEIVANINNASSRDMNPKYSLIQDVKFYAQGESKHETYNIEKVVGDPIKPQTQHEVKCELKIPDGQTLSIQTCEIIKVDYQLKVYLDISFASDPEVLFPVVIYPRSCAYGQNVPAGPYPVGSFGGPSSSDFPPPAVPVGPYPVNLQTGVYGYPGVQSSAPPPACPINPQMYAGPPGVYPPQPSLMHGGYSNPMPQVPSSYGSPYAPSSSSSVLHPPPPPPAFHSPPGPQSQPPPYSQSPSAPPCDLMPSAPVMNTDFLSQTTDDPPSYSVLFQSGQDAQEKLDPK